MSTTTQNPKTNETQDTEAPRCCDGECQCTPCECGCDCASTGKACRCAPATSPDAPCTCC